MVGRCRYFVFPYLSRGLASLFAGAGCAIHLPARGPRNLLDSPFPPHRAMNGRSIE